MKKAKVLDFNHLIQKTHLGVFRIACADTDQVIFVNPALYQYLGYDPGEYPRLTLPNLFPDKTFYLSLKHCLAAGDSVIDWEVKGLKKDGRPVVFSLSCVADINRSGDIRYLDGIMSNRIWQHQQERDLKESRELFQTVFNHSPVAITVADEEKRIVAWNPFAEKMLGLDKKELFNKHVQELYPPEEWKRLRAKRIKQSGIVAGFETKVNRKGTEPLNVSTSISLIRNAEGKVSGSIGIMYDITEQRRAQDMLLKAKIAAEEANHAKSMFLANMSHEVRTPMNTVMGMLDLTLDHELTTEQRDNLRTAKDAADILLSLLNDILDLSRVEAGKVQLENIELNVRNILKSVCKGLSVLAQNKNLELVWSVDADVPEIMTGDPIRLRQVWVNLINNAIKFTFRGKIISKIKVKALENDEYELACSVTDEGVGIPREKLDTIFEVFTQADVSTTRRFGGTGLGLTISRKLVEMMGGKIWVESEEFVGSTFHFTVRLKTLQKTFLQKPVDLTLPEPALVPPKDLSADKELTILLAEDNMINQKITVKMLEKKGWKVKAAANGKMVLELLEQEHFDLILMDAQMPVLDGYEATKLIRENEKKTGRRIPIIALTARAMSDDRQKCLDAGMDGYVSKPIDREKLFEAIANSL
jgi:PAS domain S-box-containing protein